jgi:uroporphyrinogen-III decarboxylase
MTHVIMGRGVEHAVEKGKFHIDNGIRILRLNDSPANMLVISPDNFREFIFPHMKEVCDELHSYCPEVRIYSHICGYVMPIMEDLVKTGLDCVGCLDPLGNSTTAQAREAVGNRSALLGGVNTLSFIQSSPEEIIEESRICIEGAGRDGGYVLGSGCVVPRKASKENLLALHEASITFGTKDYLSRL